MTLRRRLSLAVTLTLLGTGIAGCRNTYRSDTVLHADGSVDRAIEQPQQTTPEAARQPGIWKEVTLKDQSEGSGLFRRIVHLVTAQGHFRLPAEIPDYLRITAPPGSGLLDGKLKRQYERRDYVFVVEHRWRETLTDGVTFEDMRKARKELADLAIDLFADAFRQGIGPEYDPSNLLQWMRTEGENWLAEITDYLYLNAASREPLSQAALADGLAEICARHGLHLKAQGKLLDKDKLDQVMRDYAIQLIAVHVRTVKDGKKVDHATIATWLAKNGPLDQGWKKLDFTKYGGQKAVQDRLLALAARTVGLHIVSLVRDGEDRQCEYSLQVPGEVVATNGVLLAPDRVRWQFSGFDAYPSGYTMACRSLAPQADAQNMLLRATPLATREAMLQFVALVADDPALLQRLQECRRQHSMEPLKAYRKSLATRKGDAEQRARADQVMKFLNLQVDS